MSIQGEFKIQLPKLSDLSGLPKDRLIKENSLQPISQKANSSVENFFYPKMSFPAEKEKKEAVSSKRSTKLLKVKQGARQGSSEGLDVSKVAQTTRTVFCKRKREEKHPLEKRPKKNESTDGKGEFESNVIEREDAFYSKTFITQFSTFQDAFYSETFIARLFFASPGSNDNPKSAEGPDNIGSVKQKDEPVEKVERNDRHATPIRLYLDLEMTETIIEKLKSGRDLLKTEELLISSITKVQSAQIFFKQKVFDPTLSSFKKRAEIVERVQRQRACKDYFQKNYGINQLN